MKNLEQTVKTSFLSKVKTGLNQFKQSTFNKIAVYSLAGVLGAGLGYGCGGDETTAPKIVVLENDVSETEIYQADSKTLPEIYPINVLDVSEEEKDNYQDSTQVKDVLGIETNVYQDISKETLVHSDITKETGIHQDISKDACIDNDGDGYGINCALGFDCDDNNPAVHKMVKCNYNGDSCTGGKWYEFFCVEECQTPPTEICDNLDNNCDGKIDENLEKIVSCGYNNKGAQKQICTNGNYVISGSCNDSDVCKNEEKQEQECGLSDVGECQKGTQYNVCSNGQWSGWGTCQGEVKSKNETCNNKDDNCDGSIDESLTQTCSSACGTGIETCVGGAWKNCSASQPLAEFCDGVDNNCDGKVDEGCVICWDKTFGGSDDDEVNWIRQTKEGGYIAAGYTKSKGAGYMDAWILKLDSNGNLMWDKTFGGSENDDAKSILPTNDGKYIVAGYTYSKGAGSEDAWVFELDTNGNLEWEKTYGGSKYDGANQIQPTNDGGYVVASWTESKGAGGWDGWILKLDSEGELEWDKTYGGSKYDVIYSIQQISGFNEFGYIAAGHTDSKGAGNYDGWILRLDLTGNLKWDKTFGGSNGDWVMSVQQTSDGGYISAGEVNYEEVGDGDDGGFFSSGDSGDAWIFKLNSIGSLDWEKTFGKPNSGSIANSIQQTSDGKYITAGKQPSESSPVYDVWISKLGSNGEPEWNKTFGGSENDEAYSIQQTSDEGYIVGGATLSLLNDWSYKLDARVFKLDKEGNLDCK